MPIDPEALRARQERIAASSPPAPTQARGRDSRVGQGGGSQMAVIRALTSSSMQIQLLRYRDSPPVPGQIEAYGSVVSAYPVEGFTYAMFHDDAAVTDMDATIDSTVWPVIVEKRDGHWLARPSFKCVTSSVDPNDLTSGCSG